MRDRSRAEGLIARGLAFAIALGAGVAKAQPAPSAETPAPPPLVPPRAIDAGRVAYPEGAHGEASVVLELVVGPDGHVIDARVVDGREPFAAASIAAATAWRFEPAHRGDVTVAARVRMRIGFTEPIAPEAPAPQAAPIAAAPAKKAAQPPPEEVSVRGTRHEAGQTTLGGGEVRQIPGAFGDAFRAIEALPGVTPIVSGLPFFFVRGAPPGNVGYYLDGVRVPLLYHLGLGPSVVHPGLIDHVDFFPGGYPARYGRFAGGILAGETLPPPPRFHGEANVRLFDAGALLEAPFAGDRGAALVAGRYSYTALVLSLVAPETSLAYWDYQARASWKLGDRDRISTFVFGSYDYLGERNKRTGDVKDLAITQFHRVDLRYDHTLRNGSLRLAGTFGVDETGDDKTRVRDRLFGLRMEYDASVAPTARVRAGVDVELTRYSLAQKEYDAEADQVYPPRDNVVLGARGDVVWRAGKRVEIIPGLRADIFNSRRQEVTGRTTRTTDPVTLSEPLLTRSAVFSIDPRIATRVTLAPWITWISTFGVSHQPPAFFVPVPGLQIGDLRPTLQTSFQISQGAEIALPAELTLASTVFLHDYVGLSDVTTTCSDNGTRRDDRNACIDDRVRGRAYGLELLLRRPLTRRLTGWLSYTLSRSTREAHLPSVLNPGMAEVPSEFDRTHVLNAVGAYDLGKGWRVGGRFFYYTGRPYSRSLHGVLIPPYNSERLPPFYRIDVRLEKKWRIGEHASIAFVIEGLNVTLHKEAVDVTCQSTGAGLDVCKPEEIGPVAVPSIGVEAFF